jgi:hypothetical protein
MNAETAAPYLARLRAAQRRLVEHAARALPDGLTDPDPGASERWEAGQVWAHLAEFPGYWLEQIRSLLAGRSTGTAEPRSSASGAPTRPSCCAA